MTSIFNRSNFKIDKSGNSIAIFPKKSQFSINKNIIKSLIIFSKKNKNCNARICMHKNKKDKIQNMIVLLNKKNNSKFFIHKHLYKDEIYQVIHGGLKIDIFKKNKVFKKIILDKNKNVIVRLKKNQFHKVYPTKQIVIFHEIRLGPFRKNDSIYL